MALSCVGRALQKPQQTTTLPPWFSLSSHSLPLSYYSLLYLLLLTFISDSFTSAEKPQTALLISFLSNPPTIARLWGAFSFVLRPLVLSSRADNPLHVFQSSFKLALHHQTPRSAIYAGVMASSDDDVPLKSMKMRTNGVKTGGTASRSLYQHLFSHYRASL